MGVLKNGMTMVLRALNTLDEPKDTLWLGNNITELKFYSLYGLDIFLREGEFAGYVNTTTAKDNRTLLYQITGKGKEFLNGISDISN